MNGLVKSAWGSDDPTKAAFPFLHANALAEAGHQAQIFSAGGVPDVDPVAQRSCPSGHGRKPEHVTALGIPIHV
jgi:hypothetical protein